MWTVKRWTGPGLAVVSCLLVCWAAQAQPIEGTVQVLNGTGTQAGATGLAGVVVSDGHTVTLTDADGRFALALADGARFVWISVPSGFRPENGWYRSRSGDEVYDFTLVEVDDSGPLVFALLADVHYAPDPEQFKEALIDRRMVVHPDGVLDELVRELNDLCPDFVILVGDLVADAQRPSPDRVAEWMTIVGDLLPARLGVPFYAAVGNHDVVRDEAIGTRSYEQVFGPTYYSFGMKGVHCVVLNTNYLSGGRLVYGIDAAQLAWVRADLAQVPEHTPVLVFAHQPSWDWAATPENAALFDLLAEMEITALLTGHWHTNAMLREAPFPEWTSGAVSGAWWEGPGPDGSSFGYRVHRLQRGRLDSIWREIGMGERVYIPSPDSSILVWAERAIAQVWGRAVSAVHWWDDGPEIRLEVHSNGLWSTASGFLNVSVLEPGYRTLNVRFSLEDGSTAAGIRSFYVLSLGLTLEDIFTHPETFQGRFVAAPNLQVRAVMGSDVSATDGTKTMIIGKVPFPLSRGDRIGILGFYHPTSTTPFKAFVAYFYTKDEGK